MPRKPRNFEPYCCYHLMSRTAHQQFLFTDDERNLLVALIRKAAVFTGLELLAYCVMSNHFHVLVRLLEVPEEGVSDNEVARRLEVLYGQTEAALIPKSDYDRIRLRMYSVSEYMKIVKQRMSMGYNYRNGGHRGTLWEGRFKTVEVQPSLAALSAVAAYDDLNPVRAAVVSDPGEYHWSGWTAALGGDRFAQGFYKRIYDEKDWLAARKRHLAVMQEKAGFFRQAARIFYEGGAIGDEKFVGDYIHVAMSPAHKGGALMIPGGKSIWGELRSAQSKRVNYVHRV